MPADTDLSKITYVNPKQFVATLEETAREKGFTSPGLLGVYSLYGRKTVERYFWLRIESFIYEFTENQPGTYRHALISACRNAPANARLSLWRDIHAERSGEDIETLITGFADTQ